MAAQIISQISATILLTILGLYMLSFPSPANGAPNTEVKTALCNSGTFSGGDPFGISLSYVLEDLVEETPSRRNYSYRNISPYPNAFAYGQANCNRTLSGSNCSDCLAAAKTTTLSTCASRIGGRSVLVDCSMRYEQYPFSD